MELCIWGSHRNHVFAERGIGSFTLLDKLNIMRCCKPWESWCAYYNHVCKEFFRILKDTRIRSLRVKIRFM